MKMMGKTRIYIYVVVSIILLSMIGTIKVLRNKLEKEKSEKELYIRNANTLLESVQTYRTKDSLNVVSAGKLELKLSELKKYRSDDLKLITDLKIDRNKLENITTTQTKTIHDLRTHVRDSIVYRNRNKAETYLPVSGGIVDTLRCINVHEKWFDLSGCINRLNEFSGTFENRDSLSLVYHVKQKRFLGFLWYYGKKEKRVDVVSRNKNTKIQGVEYIEIRD